MVGPRGARGTARESARSMNLSIGERGSRGPRNHACAIRRAAAADGGCRGVPRMSRTMHVMCRTYRVLLLALWRSSALMSRSPLVAQGDADFLAATRGVRTRRPGRASTRWRRSSPDHVLAPYVEYWQQKLSLDSVADAEVARLPRPLAEIAARGPAARRLAEDAGQARPVGELRRRLSTAPSGEDVELACYGVQYRRQRDGDAALADAKPLWFTGQSTPDAVRAALRGADRQGRLVRRRPPRALPARGRGRQRAPRAGDRREHAAR